MTEDVTKNVALEKFLKTLDTKLTDPVAEIRQLAKELALGVHNGLWSRTLLSRGQISNESLSEYIEFRCGETEEFDQYVERLVGHGYGEKERVAYTLRDRTFYHTRTVLTSACFALMTDVPPFNVFISYRRSESSALALLVSARLREYELVPFVDMALEAGGNWHAELEERIKACDYFIILLSRETLASDMTAKEICWAIDSAKTIVPLWHGEFGKQEGFDLSQYIVKLAANWKDEELVTRIADIRDVILQTNAIRVTDESASGYNTAIVELLNRFGITP